MWDPATGAQIGRALFGHDANVTGAAWSPDGTRIVTSSSDGTARIWDAQKARLLGQLRGHDAELFGVAWSPDGRFIATVGADKSAWIWDVKAGTAVGLPLRGHEDTVTSAAWSPDGRHVLTTSSDKSVRLWDAAPRVFDAFPDTQSLVDKAKALAPYCLSPAQRARFFLPPEPPAWCIEEARWPYDTASWKSWLADMRSGHATALPRK
jgi:WD40 repeat protein